MESPSAIHWLIFAFLALVLFVKWLIFVLVLLTLFLSPVFCIVRSVKNSSVINCIVSVLVPFYGLVYFFVSRNK